MIKQKTRTSETGDGHVRVLAVLRWHVGVFFGRAEARLHQGLTVDEGPDLGPFCV